MMKQSIFQITVVVLLSVALAVVLGLITHTNQTSEELVLEDDGRIAEMDGPRAINEETNNQNMEKTNSENTTAVFATSHGEITLELFTDVMPITTENFITLAKDGFYDGTKFHRVIKGFMIQSGDPNSKTDDVTTYGTGGPGYTIEDEFVQDSRLSNTVGTIAMANTGQPNSGGSQFFINVADNTALDFDKEPMTSRHPVFGKVIDGMDVVQAIEAVETNERDVPNDPVVIESITIN